MPGKRWEAVDRLRILLLVFFCCEGRGAAPHESSASFKPATKFLPPVGPENDASGGVDPTLSEARRDCGRRESPRIGAGSRRRAFGFASVCCAAVWVTAPTPTRTPGAQSRLDTRCGENLAETLEGIRVTNALPRPYTDASSVSCGPGKSHGARDHTRRPAIPSSAPFTAARRD